jgi:hypothetical protein
MSGFAGACRQVPGELLGTDDPADRRAHPRIPSIQLPDTSIRIPHRPGVSLVDLSPGGALLALPFRMHPQSRLTVEIRTAAERLAVPFQFLRCYVADLKGGVRYHAAGAFAEALCLPSMNSVRGGNRERLVAALERLLVSHEGALDSDRVRFRNVLAQAVAAVRRGESADLVSVRVKALLTQMYPSLSMYPSTVSTPPDTFSSADYFGFTFRADHVLTAMDRRFLKLSAQLIAVLDDGRQAEPLDLAAQSMMPASAGPSVVYSAAEWLVATPSTSPAPSSRRIRLQPKAASPASSPLRRVTRPAEPPQPIRSRWLMGLL